VSLPRAVQGIIVSELREIIQIEVKAAYPKADRTVRFDVEEQAERALRLWLYRQGTKPLHECNPKAFVCGFLARRK